MQYINTTAAGMLEHLQIYKKKRSSSVELQKEIDKLHQMKSKAEAKKFQLYDDYTKGIVQRDIMISERTMLTEHIGEIEIELHELESKIQLEQCINKAGEEETIELLSKMETFDLDLIRQVVKRITMYDDGNIQFEWNVDDFYRLNDILYTRKLSRTTFLIVFELKIIFGLYLTQAEVDHCNGVVI